MKVLVTGSVGFVGKNLCPYLQNHNIEVVGLDKDSNGKPDENFLQHQLGSWSGFNLSQFLDYHQISSIIHLASESHVDRSISGPKAFIDNNVLGTLELFEAVKNARNEVPIILFSTDEVGACLESGAFLEKGQPFKCGSVYSASKGAQELLAQAYINTHGLQIITTRCVNIFGAHQASEKFIPTVIRKALYDESIPIYGNGMQERQWVHVDHVCKILNELAVSTCIPPESVLHITGTHEFPNNLLAHTILSLLNKPSSLIQYVSDRLGHDVRYALGKSEETDRFGLPEYDPGNFMDDLKRTVSWYEKQFSEGVL